MQFDRLKRSVIGFLNGGSTQPPRSALSAFHQGLAEQGFVEGRNLSIVFRGSEDSGRLPGLAAELAGLGVSAIVATGTANSSQAAIASTTAIPIVFGNSGDPVRMGFVASMNRPGGNATGVTFYNATLGIKRLELLRELVLGASPVAFMVNPGSIRTQNEREDLEEAARNVGQQIVIIEAGTAGEIDLAFASLSKNAVSALLVSSDAFFSNRSDQCAALAMRYRIPTSFASREYVLSGGLMSYGDNRRESYRQIGRYAGLILKGEKAADLPVLQPAKFEFVINLKTAKSLGLTFPQSFHLRADEVIE